MFENCKYASFTDFLDEVKHTAINMLVSHPTMNVGDKNFFETVAILSALYYDDYYISKEQVKLEKENIRAEVKRIGDEME